MILLSKVKETVDLSLEAILLKTAVGMGYSVDTAAILQNPNIPQPAQWNAYDNAQNTIAATKGFSVEIWGPGTAQARGQKKVPRIVLNPRRFMYGELGGEMQAQLDPNDPLLVQTIDMGNISSTYAIDINLVSNSAAQDNVLHEIINYALGVRGYFPHYDDPTSDFFYHQYNYYDLPDAQEGLLERVYSYEIRDLFMSAKIKQASQALIKIIDVELISVPGNTRLHDPNNFTNPGPDPLHIQ